MPEKGIKIMPREELLTYKEMYRLTRVLTELGVDKLRLTGGEPFVRKDFMQLLRSLSFNDKLKEVSITTNGALIEPHIPELEDLKIKAVNLSIDSLNREKFFKITRRDQFDRVWKAMQSLLDSKLQLKLNVVVQSGFNTDEITDFVELTRQKDMVVRFIEEMPFNGIGIRNTEENWNVERIMKKIRETYPELSLLPTAKSSTSINYRVKGFTGSFGVIPAFTRSICHDCNRIRITATGQFKNCLFDDGVFNIKNLLRGGASDDELKKVFLDTVKRKPVNGFVAEAERTMGDVSESMSTIGG